MYKKKTWAIANAITRKEEGKEAKDPVWTTQTAWLRIFESLVKLYSANARGEIMGTEVELEADAIYKRHFS